jgi:putative FmdB family regulatory protein
MPIYEYRCQECGFKFDRFFRSMDAATEDVSCPDCGAGEVRRLISTPLAHRGEITGASEGVEREDLPAEKPVFGRKELQEAVARRQDLAAE